jgi:hypothetical protein
MRYVTDLPHSKYKISVYQWNGKFIVKVEAAGVFEQVFKFSEMDVPTLDDLTLLFDESFMEEVSRRFESMALSTRSAMERHDLLF